MLDSALLTVAAYFTGAIPTAYLVARYWRGVDIRAEGSGNVGAVNTFKAAGLWPGITVLLLDVAKGAAVMALILALELEPEGAFAAALAVTLGHNFSIFLRLKGGKGVAVVFGLSLVIFPIITALALIALPIAWRLSRSIVWSFLATFVVLNTLIVANDRKPKTSASVSHSQSSSSPPISGATGRRASRRSGTGISSGWGKSSDNAARWRP